MLAQVVAHGGKELRALRERSNLSRAELSRRTLVDASTIARAERGEQVSPITKTEASSRLVPMFPAVESALAELLAVGSRPAVVATATSCSLPGPAARRFTGTSLEPSRRPASGPGSNALRRRISERRSARSPAGEASTRWRPRRSPCTRSVYGRGLTRARSGRLSATRLAGECLSTGSAPSRSLHGETGVGLRWACACGVGPGSYRSRDWHRRNHLRRLVASSCPGVTTR